MAWGRRGLGQGHGKVAAALAVQKGKSYCPKPSCESEELDQSQLNRHGRSFVCCGQGSWSQREGRESISAKTGEGKMQEMRFWDRQGMRDVWVEMHFIAGIKTAV